MEWEGWDTLGGGDSRRDLGAKPTVNQGQSQGVGPGSGVGVGGQGVGVKMHGARVGGEKGMWVGSGRQGRVGAGGREARAIGSRVRGSSESNRKCLLFVSRQPPPLTSTIFFIYPNQTVRRRPLSPQGKCSPDQTPLSTKDPAHSQGRRCSPVQHGNWAEERTEHRQQTIKALKFALT